MGKTDRPATGVTWPMTYREYGLRAYPDDEHVIALGVKSLELARKAAETADCELAWRAVSQWQSLDTMG